MIGTMLVLTHFILRKLGLTNCELPPGWPAYVCNTHEGGARTTTVSVSSVPSVQVAGPTSLPVAATAAPTTGPAAPSAATTAAGKPSVHPMQSVAQVQQLEPLAAAMPQPPPCITIPNPPYPGSPCPPSKYPPYDPTPQKMPFVIDNTAPTPAFGPHAGLSMATGGGNVGGPVDTGLDKNNCVTINASGVAVPCTPLGGKKGVTAGSVAGGKSTLNQPSTVSPSKVAPPK